MKVFIVGTGVMGSAIAKILAQKKHKIFVYDVNVGKARALSKYGAAFDGDFKHLPTSDFVLISVKPYHLADLNIAGKISTRQILVSIAAGVKIPKLQKLFGTKKIVRLMPNLGLSVGQGIAAWKAAGLENFDKMKVKKLLNDISENFEVAQEPQIDSVTAISGSGPAYFFALAHGLVKAAESLGLDAKISRQLVGKTFSASAALQKNGTYEELMKQIASKKGTTEQALKVFKKSGLDKIVLKAAQAAKKRAEEISNE